MNEQQRAIQVWNETEAALNVRMGAYNADPQSRWIDPFRIAGNVFYVGDRVVAAHLVDSGDGLILFDTCFPHTIDLFIKRIEFLGFRPADIRYVFHSHEHMDHFGATRELQTRFGVKTFLHKEGAYTFRIFPHHTEIQSAQTPRAALFVPDVELDDGDAVEIGHTRVQCIHTPGHAAGAVTYLFNTTEGGQELRVGLCGINGTLTLHVGRLLKYGIPLSTRDDYLASIDKLAGLEVDVSLDTHPRPGGAVDKREQMLKTPGSNPFIDSASWGRMLNDYRSRFAEFVAEEAAQLQ